MTKSKNLLSLLLSLLIIFPSLLSPLITRAAYSQANALSYLESHQGSPWVTMALVAAADQNIQSDYLKSASGSSAIDFEAPILAITSLGQNPRTFGSIDYVAKLENFDSNSQIGNTTTLNDDIFGLLALVSAGEPGTAAAVTDAKNFILSHQNTDGGWAFTVGSTSDSNTTASAVVALISDGVASSDSHIQNGLNYLKTAQNADGGFTYDPKSSFGTASDSSSTSWAIWALNAVGIDPHSWSKTSGDPISYLSSNQTAAGLFQYQTGSGEDSFSAVTTSYAFIALSGKTLPIAVFHPVSPTPTPTATPTQAPTPTPSSTSGTGQFPFRIEGSLNTVCSGLAQGPTALDIVKNASIQCGFTYDIKQTSFGLYLDQIGNDTASGNTGWLYLVNDIAPSVGAADFQLKQGDSLLWYFGDFTWLPTQISINSSKINSGQAATVTVQDFSNGSWLPLSGSVVNFGAQSATTDSSGTAQISPTDGFYKIFASKNGFVRSNSVSLQVGQPDSASVSLSANLQLGQVQGTTTQGSIAFTVNPSSLDFGTLSAGGSATKNVTITNNGTAGITVSAVVGGDDVFKNDLSIGGSFWNSFQLPLTASQSKPVPVTLAIPQSATGTSHQAQGSIVFWATSQ